jgi:endonuclease YncB( thermonuclease family)
VVTTCAVAIGAALTIVAAPHLPSYRLAILPAAAEPPRPAPALAAPAIRPPVVLVAKEADEPVTTTQSTIARERYEISWPFDIADGLTFGPEGAVKTRLAGLDGPPRDAVCSDRHGQPWACGLQARATLNNVTRRHTLSCQPVGRQDGRAVAAACTGAVDVARELVLAGFARPVGRDTLLELAEDEARRNERGMWNGGWTIRMAVR